MTEFEEKSLLIAGLGTSLTARGAWLDRDPVELEPIGHRPVGVMNFASVGATSRVALTVVDEVARARPDIAIIEFASNDAALHRRVSLTRSAANVTAIIRRLHAASYRETPAAYLTPIRHWRRWVTSPSNSQVGSVAIAGRDRRAGFRALCAMRCWRRAC